MDCVVIRNFVFLLLLIVVLLILGGIFYLIFFFYGSIPFFLFSVVLDTHAFSCLHVSLISSENIIHLHGTLECATIIREIILPLIFCTFTVVIARSSGHDGRVHFSSR